MKILLAALLSAALIYLAPHTQETPVNNLEPKAAVTETTKQPPTHSSEHLVTTVAKVETPSPQVPKVQPEMSPHQVLMHQAGIPQEDWSATDYIVSHESSWRPTATNTSSGAYGLCQALPASKMASAGADYRSNPVTQLKWCHSYAVSRYHGWWSAFAFWKSEKWW